MHSDGFTATEIHGHNTDKGNQAGIGNDLGLLKRHAWNINNEPLFRPDELVEPARRPKTCHESLILLYCRRPGAVDGRNIVVVVGDYTRSAFVAVRVECFRKGV